MVKPGAKREKNKNRKYNRLVENANVGEKSRRERGGRTSNDLRRKEERYEK